MNPDPYDEVLDYWTWSVEMLVLMSFALQILLTLFGSHRRKKPGILIRFTVWSAYLLSSTVAKIAIGKLTAFSTTLNHTQIISKGLLAPLILIQIGNPDTITAYSRVDNQLGLRQLLGLFIQVGVVLWIIVRCLAEFKSLISYLYFSMFLAGIIKYGEAVWALKLALHRNSGITALKIDQEENVPASFRKLPESIPGLELILKAYYRFNCLKPHIDNWVYQPLYDSLTWMSIDDYSLEDVFRITDVELGFMYDVLYTKAPIIYTWAGCILRIISFLSLVSTLCGFAFLLKDDLNLTYEYLVFLHLVIVTAVILELYQILLLPFSDWAIIQMIRHQNMPAMMHCLRILGPMSSKWKRWSNLLGQFSLLDFCLHDKHLKVSRFLKFRGMDMEFRKYRSRTRTEFPKELKILMVQEMEELNKERASKPITQRGQWALERYGCHNEMKWSVKRDFDKSITIWHIATDICYHSEVQKDSRNSQIEMTKLLSNYFMYLLAMRPQMLCSVTADTIFEHASTKLMTFLRNRPPIISDEGEACRILMTEELPRESYSEKKKETMVTSKWYVLHDAQRLAKNLMDRENKWQIISSVWMEMLCYAASNCPVEYHAEQLRRGGGLITHVWLLLAHKTDQFYISD